MKITKLAFYGGAREKVCRLGLFGSYLELQDILLTSQVTIIDRKRENGIEAVSESINASFEICGDWRISDAGGIDRRRSVRYGDCMESRMGVSIPFSGRNAQTCRDIVHIRNSLQDSEIDVGVIVVPSDEFEYRLTDRVANLTYAKRYIEEELREAQTYPIVLVAIEHDGFTDKALPKMRTNLGSIKDSDSAPE